MRKQKYSNHLIKLYLSLTLVFFSTIANSGNFPKTEADFAQLPPFCKARMKEQGTANYKRWNRKLGPKNFIHIHHLCSGLHSLNTARMIDRRSPLYGRELTSAIGGIDYVLRSTDKSFSLYPVMLLKKGEVFLLLGNPGKAIAELEKAIQANPKYSPAYAKLSDIYIQLGNKNKAKEIIQQGLKYSPKSKLLKRKLKKL